MEQTSRSYKIIAWAVTFGLLLQSFPFLLGLGASRPVMAETMALDETAVTTPPTNAIAIARAQSSYASGDELTITYTVYNSLPPTQAPDVTPGQPLTDTLAALDNFDLLADPNTLRQVIVTYEPTEASFVSASLPASLDNGVYTFHLDDIPPLGSVNIVIELDGPANITDPTELDSGAAGWGMVNGRAHHTTAAPAILWPDNMGDWLTCTLDANCDDTYVIEQAAQLGQDPAALFTFVRELGFESYTGSLRGARGTLWSAAGNSADQSSLLIALLRASGVPARYRSGQLANPHIETLILSMFPQPLGVIGHLPTNNPFPQANPQQNTALWDETRSHWWVEAYLPGQGWVDMDPSFAQAEIGDRFVDPPDPTPLAELPASLRHSVTIRIKVEMYHPLSGLTHSYPLDHTFSAVELVGEPVTLGHMVNSQNQGGMIFANVFHTYTPYLMLAGQESLLEGTSFQELFTNFPLATTIVTGEWLLIDLHHPDGTVESHERALYDAIGYDARLNGGNIQVGGDGRTNQPFISDLTLITGLFAPSFMPVSAIDGEYAAAATAVTAGQSAYAQVNEIMADGEVTAGESDDLIAAAQAISRLTRASQRVLLMQYAAAADFGTQRLGDSFLVRPYYDMPRVHLMAWETDTVTGQQRVSLDLRRNQIRALPYPDQSWRGWQAFNVAYGLAAMNLESDLLQRLSPDEPVHSVANILSAAQAQGIPLTIISPANLDDLADLTISDEAKARISADLLQNPRHFVIVPIAPVLLGDVETVGWLRSNIASGETIDVSEDGLHLVSVEYSILINGSIQEIGFAIAGFGQGFAGFTLVFLGEFLSGIPGDMKAAWNAALAAAEQWASEMADLLAEMGDHDWIEAFINGAGIHGGGTVDTPIGEFSFGEFDLRQGGFNNGAAMAASVIGSADPPLPPALAARLPEHEFYRPAVGVVAATASSSGTAVSANLLLESFNAQGVLSAAWDNSAQSGLRFQQLSGQGALYVDGALVGNGAVTAVAADGQMETSGDIAYQRSGTGGIGFYAPAVSGLGSGAYSGETAVTLTPAATAELALRGATATLNGQIYSGNLTLVTTAPVALQATGAAAAPHFAPSASLTANNATLGLPPTSGTLTIGGTAVSLQDGLMLPNFSGTVAVSEATAATDQVSLTGDAHYFRLAADPANSATTPGSPATFQAEISANFSDSYTITLSAPGWAAAVAADGSLTVTPTLTTLPGDYTVLVTAQSALYPTAVAAAAHTVTVNAMQGVDVTIQPDPIYTIPFGEPTDPANTTTNNGQAQIPGAAYTAHIVNRSSQPHTFAVTVTGLNPNWLIFAGEAGQTAVQITLPAGGMTWLGLYLQPDTPTLPAPGSSYPFTVTAVAAADPTINDSDSATFVMPAIPFQHLWLEPSPLFAMSGDEAEFTVHLRNVGNAPGSFDLATHLPTGWQVTGLQAPVAVNPGQTASQVVILGVPTAPLGSVHQVSLSSPVPGQAYTQWATLNTRLVSANTGPIFAAAAGCLANEQALAAALQALALAMAALEESCDGGCALALRDQTVAAAISAANYGRLTSPLGQTYTELETAAASLATAADDAAILAALPGITTAVTGLEEELCAIKAHRPTVRLTPWMNAALPDQSVDFDLEITNRGTVTTTYAVTVTLPDETLTFPQMIAPGATVQTAVPAAASDLALYLIDAEVTAVNTPLNYITAQAQARLNVVDRFIQVTAVAADPPFVETGASSTLLQVEIANVAGIGLAGEVETAVYHPSGSQQWSDTIPLNILGGAPRLYDLADVDTSGWAAGIYTITANVRLNGAATTGGDGYGYLSVGQAVIPSHAVAPELVAPGTVTVTTAITTEINPLAIGNDQLSMSNESDLARQHTIYDAPYWQAPPVESAMVTEQLAMANERSAEAMAGGADSPAAPALDSDPLPVVEAEVSLPLTFNNADLPEEQVAMDHDQVTSANEELDEPVVLSAPAASSFSINLVVTRTEQNDAAISYTGTWTNVTLNQASGGSYWRNATAGSTAVFTFTGDWLTVGLIGGTFGGFVAVDIDGISQGAFDLYRRDDNTAVSLFFPNLGNAPHTVTLTVLGSSNPFASGTRVQLDYFDVGDGTPLADGTFEQDDPRLILSNGWTTVNHANASGGSYVRATAANGWFPFSGDSFSLHAIAYSGGGKTQLFVDGAYLDTVSFYHPNSATNAVTRTFAYEGFGPGVHTLQVKSYRDNTTIDALTTPGQPPFIDPHPAPGSINRYEEEHTAVLYNGVPFTQTAQSWSRVSAASASDGQYMRSATANDTISFDFAGSWLNLGFYADRFSGYAEIFIDGLSHGVVDLYRREDTAVTHFFGDLTPGSHTISVVVLGSSGPFASNNRVQLDFIEFGDGVGLEDGTFEQDDARVLRAGSWTTESNTNASGGSFIRSGSGSAWFHFAGDSFTYQAMAYSLGDKTQLFVDGRYLDTVNLYHPNSLANAITRTFSYEGFGPGPHVLQISSYRGQAMLDALTTPGQPPFIDPQPPVTGITRFEEEHPAIRYNGVPYTQTAQSWTRINSITSNRASDGQYFYSAAAGDTISFDFEGSWVGVGFATDRFGGQAEIAIDGAVVTAVDLYTRENDTESFYFNGLSAGPHTLTITVLGTSHPNASSSRVHLDYFDVWDGLPLAEGTFEETDERFFFSSGWSRTLHADASGGAYANSGGNDSTAWFPFTGDSVTFQAWTAGGYHSLELKIDGVSQGYLNTYGRITGPRVFSFAGLGDGPHVIEVRRYRSNVIVDAFITPATGEHYELPTPSGVIRLEEDHPDLRYNGYPFRTMPQSWSIQSSLFRASGNYNATSAAGNTLSLEFEGTWVGVGFVSGGVVEIFIDGESQGTFDTASPSTSGEISSVYFDNLISGTHTISMTAVSGNLRPDFIDIWDGQSLAEGWYNGDLDDYSGRFHYSNKSYWGQYENQYAYAGDYLSQNLINANPNIWFTFVGSDLTLLGFNRAGSILNVTIDGIHAGEYDMTAAYSNQPYALHFPNLGDGPHTVQIHTRGFGRVDAFEVNPADFYSYTPQIKWHDDSAKEALDPAFRTGFVSSIALGDLNGDGVVELVAPANNGRLYVYRGDGADAGNGTPIQWYTDLVGPAAEPALADLTGDGLSEIIISGYYGLFAFRHDGIVLWQEESIKAYSGDGGGLFGWGGPTIGNLDDDSHPEIVIAASEDALYVLDHQGNILDSDPIGRWPSVPVLADITGDGTLDIIAAQGHTLKLYEYDPINGLEIAWTYTLTNTTLRSGVFGSPAVADLTGDGQPEIIINWGPRIEAIKADGSQLWSYYTGSDSHYRPSPITIADTTGDGQINIITASAINAGFLVFDHLLMVLNGDGTLVWQQTVADNTASASGVAAQDLTGNGVWEVLWNGATDGFLVLRGSDGKRLFNEPFTGSGTIMEYPTLGDVDGDGVADVVVSGREGIFVISHVGRWINSRPMWNQHNYHVTNINDDWSIPLSQPNSWELHNTYRTQTPEQNPAPSYRVEITHTVGVSQVTVLSDTFSTPPTGTPPTYHWQYQLEWYAPVNTITFASELADMQPGETRQINQGTAVGYRLPSGWNYLTLPPLYVTAAHILEIAPESQAVGVGSTAVYTLTLLNPGPSADLYSLDVIGLPDGWANYPTSVNVPAQGSAEVLLEVVTPPDAELAERPFLVTVITNSDGQDMATASLTLFNGLEIGINPPEQTAPTGTAVTYTLTLTNSQSAMVNYQLAADGLAAVELPDEIEIPGETAVSIPITVSSAAPGPQPFTVTAVGSGGSDAANAVLVATGNYAIGLALDPETEVGGPGVPTGFNLTVTNLGDVADSYDLSLALPPGWSGQLDANGTPVDSIALPAHIFNNADLRLRITPEVTAVPGSYEFSVTAASQDAPGVQNTITAMVELLPLGVILSINPQQTTMSPLDSGLWQVTITNTGEVADSYDLLAAGVVSLTAELSSSTVTLAPGQSQTVQLTTGPLPLVLPQTYPFWVTAVSQADERIANEAEATITFTGYEGVAVAWLPTSQTVTNTLSADFTLVLSNTGNLPTIYQLGLVMPGLSGQLPVTALAIPAQGTAMLPLTVQAGAPGTYTLTAAATSAAASNEATATLTIVQTADVLAVDAGPDQEGYEGSPLAFSGDLTGGSGPYTIEWDFGDGSTAAGSLTPIHTYADNGSYTVTLLVTDSENQVVSDSLVVIVNNVPPLVTAVADQTIGSEDMVSGVLAGFSDPGVLDTHTAVIDWGDGVVAAGIVDQAAGTVSGAHTYAAPGVYTVTITVTDSDGGVGSDTLRVTVTAAGYKIYLPIIVK